MVRFAGVICLSVGLSACGAPDAPQQTRTLTPPTRPAETGVIPFASGPIGAACLAHQRKGATRARCGCVQAAANQTLSAEQQQRSVRFFSEPGQLQDVRQSSAPGNERFWDAWKQFADRATLLCGDVNT
ncbi:hypothetical protein [Roseobacter sp.]|uniref:hypothetical protein n=1 Tax=Roseobacter sp. TaxID=1907202 RepID=UPI00329A0C7C